MIVRFTTVRCRSAEQRIGHEDPTGYAQERENDDREDDARRGRVVDFHGRIRREIDRCVHHHCGRRPEGIIPNNHRDRESEAIERLESIGLVTNEWIDVDSMLR